MAKYSKVIGAVAGFGSGLIASMLIDHGIEADAAGLEQGILAIATALGVYVAPANATSGEEG